MKKVHIKIAGIINLIVAFVHLFMGQWDLVDPLINSNMELQQKGELIAAWHIVTIFLFATSYMLLLTGFSKDEKRSAEIIKPIGIFYVLASLPFITVSVWYGIFAPQWIFLLPIGIFALLGVKK